jgi:ligand-binding sensor domain-containing protein
MVGKMRDIFVVRFSLFDFWKFALLLFFLGFGGICNAQKPQNPFIFKQFLDGNSTTTNIVSCFLEDKDGFLWVGTMDGLKRFDGNDFTIFRHDNNNPHSLAHNEIEALCEDNAGRIWVGSGQGIGYFDKKTNQFYNFKEFNKSNHICFNIVCDDKSNIWFSIRKKGLFRYSIQTKKMQNFAHNPSDNRTLLSNRIYNKGMLLDPLKRGLWLQTERGINFFDFASQNFFHKNNNPRKFPIYQSENCRGLALDGNNLIFFDTDAQKITYFDVVKELASKEIAVKNSLSKVKIGILYVFVDSQHNLWLSDWFRFCYYLDIKRSTLTELDNDPNDPNSIASNSFWCTYQQKDGTIWLGTNNGISTTNPQKNLYKVHDIAALYPPLRVRNQLYAFKEDERDSTWWLAADEQSFVHYDPQNNHLEGFDIPKNPKCPDAFIQTFAEYKHDLYVVSTNSIHLFDKKKKTFKSLTMPDSLNYKNLISNAIQRGDSIWFFCDNAKAYSYKITTKKWTQYPILTTLQPDQSSSYPFLTNTHQKKTNSVLINAQSSIYCSEIDNNGDIWIAIQNTGLAKFSKQKQAFELVEPKNEGDYKNLSYTAMRKDKDGNFLIGTYGLLKFNPKTRAFSSVLNTNVINDLLIDKEGKIWLTAYNDFTILNPITNKKIKQTIPMNKGNLLWINTLFFLKNGQIASLMRGVVAVIDPTKLIPPTTKDKVLISKIQVFGSEILLHHNGSSVNFQASENVFIVYFATLNLSDENKYTYQYQLSGYQDNWDSTPEKFTSYTNLDGGDYVFNVKGIDSNGYETPVSTLNIHIDTVFYKSRWFLYFCLLSVCGLIYAFVKFRANHKAKIIQLEMQSTRLEKDKTEIQYQNLINHLNPHFLFNSLTSLNSLIMTEPKEASKFLQKLSLIYRYILQNKDKEIISLEQELAFVKHYIELQKSRFEDGLQINIEVKEAFMNAGIVPVTLQNLFENAIKHNSLEEDNPLTISVFVENEFLIVKNNLQRKKYVQTSNKQGLESLKSLYKYLSKKPFEIIKTESEFVVKIPLL